MHTALSRLNEEERKEYWACLALRYAPKIGTSSVAKLINHFGSAYKAVQNLERWEEVSLDAKAKYIAEDTWREMAAVEWENAKDLNAHIILWTDKNYPHDLRNIHDAPAMLYALGNLELLKKPCIAIVGSRMCTNKGMQIAEYLATALSLCGFTIISGMAKGIDRAGHFGGLKFEASSIGVLGSGIDIAYPNINSDLYHNMLKKGLLLSEFAPATPPDPRHFPVRNRIISGMSQGVVVIEASTKSGSTITAYTANEQGKNVYAVPGAVGAPQSFGCQQLIRSGAKAIFNVEDILEDIYTLVGLSTTEIDKLLKSHKLSTNDLFKHNSTLVLDNYDNKESKSTKNKKEKKSNTTDLPLLEEFKSLYTQEDNKQDNENREKQEEVIEMHKAWYTKESLEYKILELVFEKKMHVDNLCKILDISVQELTVCLINLEMKDHITRYEGSWYGRYK